MHYHDYYYDLHQERAADLRREAEHARLARGAEAGRRARAPRGRRARRSGRWSRTGATAPSPRASHGVGSSADSDDDSVLSDPRGMLTDVTSRPFSPVFVGRGRELDALDAVFREA